MGLCAALLFSSVACGGSAEQLWQRSLAATCSACHGTDGEAVQGAAIPRLAGLSKGYIVLQMQSFRDGTRPATVMQQIARGYSDAQTEALAAYFERQYRAP
jgi:cytochrome c553